MQEQLQLPGFSGQNVKKLIIQLVDIWFLKYTKSPRKIHYYYDEIAYAYLLVHNSFSSMSENSEESFVAYWKIKKLIDRLDEDNAFWIVKLPWKLKTP
jgi:CRISPR/Cas system-associated protein Cas5 (RAMP superfamily)